MAAPSTGSRVAWCVMVISAVVTLADVGVGARPARAGELSFRRLSTRDGLTHDSVTAIAQDRSGFLWFATVNGLNRYDGGQFETLNQRPGDPSSLSHSWLRCLMTASDGSLWLGTNAGLDVVDPRTWEVEHLGIAAEGSDDFGALAVHALLEDDRGRIWVGRGDGLFVVDRVSRRMSSVIATPDDQAGGAGQSVEGLQRAADGRVLVLSVGRLWQVDPDGTVLQPLDEVGSIPELDGMEGIVSFAADDTGRLWIGTAGQGLASIEPGGATIRWYGDAEGLAEPGGDTIASILQTMSGTIWVGSRYGGLYRLDPVRGRFDRWRPSEVLPGCPACDRAEVLFDDRQGTLWVGTYGGGVVRVEQPLFEPIRVAIGGRADPSVVAVAEDAAGDLWIGTDSGLGRRRHGAAVVELVGDPAAAGEPLRHVREIAPDPDGSLWIGTLQGLVHLRPDSGKTTVSRAAPGDRGSLSHDHVRSVLRDGAGRLWVGTRAGLDLMGDDGRFQHYRAQQDPGGLTHDDVYALAEGSAGELWLGTLGGGLFRLDPERGVISRMDGAPGGGRLRSLSVTSLAMDDGGALWVGTLHGLHQVDTRTGEIRAYGEAEGLANETVYCVLVDGESRVWVSTDRGLSRFDPSTSTFWNFDVEDGLQNNEFNGGACHAGADGTLYFGGIDGFNAFDPRTLVQRRDSPVVVITAVEIDSREVSPTAYGVGATDPLSMGPDAGHITVAFAALDYLRPEKTRYSYRLEGLDSDWIDAGSRRYASYANLPSGKYRFTVRGAGSDGTWSAQEAAIDIDIPAPLWHRWWFRLAAVVTLVALFGVFHAVRVQDLQRQRVSLARQVDASRAELIEAQRRLMLTERHDALTGLLNRQGLLDRVGAEAIRAQRSRKSYVLAVVALDELGVVNQRFGHECGDELLRRGAEVIKQTVRRQDAVGRWGGGSFLLLLPETDEAGGRVVTAKLEQAIGEQRFDWAGDHAMAVSWAITSCEGEDDVHACVRRAFAADRDSLISGESWI